MDARHKYGGATHWGAGVPRYRVKDWTKPLAWNRKAAASGERWTVFPSLCDPFDNEVPQEWHTDLWRLIMATPALTWLLLTKRIGNATKFIPCGVWPANAWLGASIVNQEEADRDIPKLLAAPATKRFVSYEPALGPVDFTSIRITSSRPGWSALLDPLSGAPTIYRGDILNGGDGDLECPPMSEWGPKLDWIIVGGESRQGRHQARPFNIEWARSTLAQCRAAGVAFFMKQTGSDHTRLYERVQKDRAGADPAEWPDDIRIQQFPE